MTRLGVFGTAAALALAATTQVNAQGGLPQGEGRDIVAVACSQCHTLPDPARALPPRERVPLPAQPCPRRGSAGAGGGCKTSCPDPPRWQR